VERRRASGAAFPIDYEIQPVRNISLTRNRTVALANAEWLAFIDDDERAPVDWLQRLAAAAAGHAADGVLGPVEPLVPSTAPDWLQRGRFYDWSRMHTGTVIPPNKLRFGNVLLRASLLHDMPAPFDPGYGLSGGEDGDLLARMVQTGARIIWCDQAIVHEPVETARLSLHWLLRRALRGGQDFARHRLAGRYGQVTIANRLGLLLRALLQTLLAAGLAPVSWPRGRHRVVFWLLKASANLGKLSVFLGWHYQEYKGTAP
jgi:succinoglycan biosynthesis protein ExoM